MKEEMNRFKSFGTQSDIYSPSLEFQVFKGKQKTIEDVSAFLPEGFSYPVPDSRSAYQMHAIWDADLDSGEVLAGELLRVGFGTESAVYREKQSVCPDECVNL